MNKSARLEIRLSEAQKERWEQARKLGGYPSISALLMESMEDTVNRIFVENRPPLDLGAKGIQKIIEILSAPAEAPNEALIELMKQDFTNIVNILPHIRKGHNVHNNQIHDRAYSKITQKKRVRLRK